MGRVRSWLAAPAGARVLGVAFALAGIALLGLGVFAFGGSGGSAAAPTPSAPPPATATATSAAPPPATTTGAPSSTAAPTSQLPATTPPPPPATTSSSPAPVRAPLTVLNNSTIRGLGERAAAQARARGWTVASVGNFAGVIPVSTVYYTPGDPAAQAAAQRLQLDLPQVARVLPRYAGLPPTPTGVVLVVTRDWS